MISLELRLVRKQLLLLGATALAIGRAFFVFIDDPEGPNVLVVFVMAVFVFLTSLALYTRFIPFTSLRYARHVIGATLLQVVIVAILVMLLR
jgi:hypothetical protein